MISVTFSVYLISNIIGILSDADLPDLAANEECPRIRRSWLDLSTEERDLYISGLLAIREKSKFDRNTDEFLSIGDAHNSAFAAFTHLGSDYFYWHGYLVWELESRIRALGGKYSCFGMPYWDFTKEEGRMDDPQLFYTGIGGNGDPADCWTVNEYSWPQVTTEQFWIPEHCCAEADADPVCSLKRAWDTNDVHLPTATDIGKGMMEKDGFSDFAQWYTQELDNPVMMLHGTSYYDGGNDVSFDPLWYLYHSFVEYQRFMWTDCHQYDQIEPNELENYSEAYEAYCDADDCVVTIDQDMEFDSIQKNMDLDAPMYFGESLTDKDWAYVHDHDLSIRQFYFMSKQGVIFDLSYEDEDGFYTKSGMNEYCQGKLNETWWIYQNDDVNEFQNNIENKINLMWLSNGHWDASLFTAFLLFVAVGICLLYVSGSCHKNKSLSLRDDDQKYGTFEI